MQNNPAVNGTAHLTDEEIGQLWHLARTIHLREAIPPHERDDLRSRLFAHALEKADYLAARRHALVPVATQMMKHDVLDFIHALNGPKGRLLATAQPLDAETDEDDFAPLQVVDPNDGWAAFLADLDHGSRRRALANWRRRFRRRLAALPARKRAFLEALATTASRADLMSATGLSRKGCYLNHQWLKQTFADLLAQHRAIGCW